MKVLSLPVVIGLAGLSTTVTVIAGLVVAVVIVVAAIFLFRSSGKKGSKTAAGGGTSWQLQQPQANAGGWNQQAGMGDNNWAQQQQGGWGAQAQGQQQAGGWGASPQQPGGGWGAPTTGQPGSTWGAQGAQGAQSPQGAGQPSWGAGGAGQPGWGTQGAAQPQATPSAWGSPATNAAQPSSSWGNQGSPSPWEAPPAPAPQQDQWGQQAGAQGGSPWAMGGAQPAQPGVQAPTAYGGSSGPAWGQQSAQDAWGAQGAQAAQQPYPGAPATPAPNSGWQQGGFGQVGAGQPQQFSNPAYPDSDKTVLRSTGPQSGLGIIRVEEGKEPGRIYEIRKDSLSIGRSRESDIFLEDLAVSRLHASIVSIGNGNYALKDEGSANGTKVNGQVVNKYQTIPLQEGDKIQLGQTVLVFARK